MTEKTRTDSATKAETKSNTAKVGQLLNFDATFTLRLPDGTVVTGRGSYLPRRPGTYVVTVAGKERTIEVGE